MPTNPIFVFIAQVKVNFMIPGHTHNDVDQFFSRLSVWLNHHHAHTVAELFDGFKTSFVPRVNPSNSTVNCDELTETLDAKAWLEDFTPGPGGMKGMRKCHQVRMRKPSSFINLLSSVSHQC